MNEAIDTFGANSGAIAVTAVLLFLFGWLFNYGITWLHREGLNDGYTWLEVVVGVAVVVGAAGLTIGWGAVLTLLIYFTAAGFWMAAGDIMRHVKARKAEARDREG